MRWRASPRFVGRRVIRDNHIGDWGTQFGMLLLGWKTELNREALLASPLDEMERIYKLISARGRKTPRPWRPRAPNW